MSAHIRRLSVAQEFDQISIFSVRKILYRIGHIKLVFTADATAEGVDFDFAGCQINIEIECGQCRTAECTHLYVGMPCINMHSLDNIAFWVRVNNLFSDVESNLLIRGGSATHSIDRRTILSKFTRDE